MILVIATTQDGKFTKILTEHDNDWVVPRYREAVYDALGKVFRRLRRPNKYPLTIMEVEYDTRDDTKESDSATESERPKALLESIPFGVEQVLAPKGLQTFHAPNRPGNKEVQVSE